MTNVGVRPTVGGDDELSVETHLIGYDGDLYGATVRVELLRFLREEHDQVWKLRNRPGGMEDSRSKLPRF